MSYGSKIEVLRQAVTEIAEVFPSLVAWNEIYLSPAIISGHSSFPLEIQVAEGASEYPDHDGEVRREDFYLEVGILQTYRLDSDKRSNSALSDLALSIFAIKQTIIDQLDGSFLNGLLVRPLIIRRESAVQEQKETTLVKILTFSGGLNEDWVNT